jgi:hypothetical protein
LQVDGDVIIPYRSPLSVRNGGDEDLSFKDWDEEQPLPSYQDHVTGYGLAQPRSLRPRSDPKPDESQYVHPSHSSFGPPSMVKVPYVSVSTDVDVDTGGCHLDSCDAGHEIMIENLLNASDKYEAASIRQPEAIGRKESPRDGNGEAVISKELTDLPSEVPEIPPGRRSRRSRRSKNAVKSKLPPSSQQYRPVGHRWYYEPVPVCVMTSEQSGVIPDNLTARDEMSNEVSVVQPADSEPTSAYGLPSELGPVVPVSIQDIQNAGDGEWAAWYVQGILFYDEELEWCRIIGWGAECGVIIVHYSPVTALDNVVDEHHSSLSDMLTMIMQSPTSPVIPDYMPSRVLRRSEALQTALCYRQTGYTVLQRNSGVVGSCKIRQLGARVGSYNGKVLSTAVIKRILRAQETIFKYGTMIPRNDSEADRSPEAPRWVSGRTLEWIRLNQVSTFDSQWTWKKVQQLYPNYLKTDIGHMFFIYDYKYSGEHRVRLVFDGSKQSPATYSVTYAPTVRAESVRLFHIYAIEYSWAIQQYDVPQAFLRSDADCDIFAYPPNGFAEFPGQLLKLNKMLYGSKQAAALWYNLLNSFLLEIGFMASSLDPCFYRRPVSGQDNSARSDAILILHVDDMRVAAEPTVLASIHLLLFQKFEITTSDSGRFLGMDTSYDLSSGVMRMHMATYINETAERFLKFDLSRGVPYRELVGSLMWIVLCIMGPELLRVKDLARRSNHFTLADYDDAIKVLHRVIERKEYGIIYRRGAAGMEKVPASARLGGDSEFAKTEANTQGDVAMLFGPKEEKYTTGDGTWINELAESDLYKLQPDEEDRHLDIVKVMAPTNPRFTMVAYSDASFAVGELKQSITGFLVMINGIPLLWGSLKQTTVVDSTCSAEYVASSVCCKQILHAENMMQFLDFTCPKPYTMYTDSQACLQIATNMSKLGMVRHIGIRYHLVRCLIMSGDIKLYYCITEDMLADIFTKIVAGAQDKRLMVRFYNDCDELLLELSPSNV